jgi:hypothetical protein
MPGQIKPIISNGPLLALVGSASCCWRQRLDEQGHNAETVCQLDMHNSMQ